MTSAFDYLLGTTTRRDFLDRHYGREPILLKGDKTKFKEVFSISELNRILNFTPLTYPRTRVTDHANTIHKYDLITDKDRYANNLNNDLDSTKLVAAIAKGGTLVVDRVHQLVPALERFVEHLSAELGMPVSANGYYSSRRQLGVNPHFDQHDVFALQVHGSKRWYFRHDLHTLSQPMRRQRTPSIDADRTGWSSVLLNEGDAFYCPRGVWHFTETDEQNSAHVAVGLYPMTLGDWLAEQEGTHAVTELLEQAVQGPSGFDNEALKEHLQEFVALLQRQAGVPRSSTTRLRPHIELD
jgi:ribosomal protein L16 Arg81 hydroxylase